MPIEYCIDHARRLVMAKGYGTLTHEDIFGYQRDVWSIPELAGYDELVDMSHVEHIALPSTERIQELARLSAGMDACSLASRFAIVAPTDLAFGLGRMYATYRSLDDRSTKQVGVFRSREAALAFLGISST
jgi:hypothetical protein